MKSAFDWFQEAAKFEQLARDATSEARRKEFLAKAAECRKLAKEAQATDAR